MTGWEAEQRKSMRNTQSKYAFLRLGSRYIWYRNIKYEESISGIVKWNISLNDSYVHYNYN